MRSGETKRMIRKPWYHRVKRVKQGKHGVMRRGKERVEMLRRGYRQSLEGWLEKIHSLEN